MPLYLYNNVNKQNLDISNFKKYLSDLINIDNIQILHNGNLINIFDKDNKNIDIENYKEFNMYNKLYPENKELLIKL